MSDYRIDAQEAADNHLTACWDWFHAQDDGGSIGGESPASAPFCGCQTCEVREVLWAAFPILAAGIRDVLAAGIGDE